MPKWNLTRDYSSSHGPKGATSFSMPIRALNIPLNKYSLKVEVEHQPNMCVGKGNKKLIIDIDTSQKVEVLAMAPGSIINPGACIRLDTQIFFTIGTLAFRSRHGKNGNPLPFAWFANWMEASLVPGRIVYDNVVPAKTKSGNVRSGEVIGTAGNHPTNAALKRLVISIAYAGPIKGVWDGMHPREFFSLLFWKKENDPVFKQNPGTYGDPLLRRMMATDEHGKTGLPSTFISAPKDIWLGLRPPLRTFERVQWEHVKEHLQASNENTWDWRTFESVKNRIFNKYVARGNGYVSEMKCNIYTGEMLFRSGFRTIIWARGYGTCSANEVQNRLKYLSPARVDKIFEYKVCGIHKDSINFSTMTSCTSRSQATHSTFTCFGKKETPDKNKINTNIQVFGDAYFATTGSHVPIVFDVDNVTANLVKLSVLDQNWKMRHDNSNFTRSNYVRKKYNRSPLIITVIRALPGGDPTEEWGMLKSNCLKTLTKAP